ncbi:ADP-ribosylglycohydrolase family protein [Chroococcidiopsis sp. FACHB-1243]|uniref:ADP-ribosylglycohydrolase family protein n=1 Tax=Chroococcidiopsis sp. [FACHB-1243] TaxID=2692781 RepID=UPI00177C81A3|nr:ADP-ribosylglycohydrolase family protein [Chroococcidiopsis sp. [FACHB-1243]]MBD2306841.1 ADP-ribosylglycohydrolase family protein [Chroococcidiopsis sp. [FACHB-1243]]
MSYSIHSRFRGTMLGMAVGEVANHPRLKAKLSERAIDNSSQSELLDSVLQGIKTLIALGRFDYEAWHKSMTKELTGNSIASPLATLPISVFFHENELKLRQNLQLALVAIDRDEPESRDGTLAIGQAIATALQAKSNPIEIISQAIAFVGASPTATAAKLSQVKELLDERVGLERAIAQLGQPHELSSQIALAFFCYLSTPADFRLTVQRAAISDRSGVTSAIAGALSGAYNGVASIPATQALAIGVTNQTEVLRLCDVLVAVWSGVYQQSDRATANNQIVAIAAPKIVRRR